MIEAVIVSTKSDPYYGCAKLYDATGGLNNALKSAMLRTSHIKWLNSVLVNEYTR